MCDVAFDSENKHEDGSDEMLFYMIDASEEQNT